MQTIDFYELSRSAQERFLGSVNGSGLPAPILRTNPGPKGALAWMGASAASFVLTLVFYRIGYGSLTSGLAKQGVGWAIADAVLIGLLVFGVLQTLALRGDHKRSHFRRGIYVFPVGLIDASAAKLKLYPIEDLSNVAQDASGLRLSFGATSFAFPVADAVAAETAKNELERAKSGSTGVPSIPPPAPGGGVDSTRPKALAALDPLQGYANPLASSDRLVRTSPTWATFGWALAVVTGGILGTSLWMLRNAASDDAMYTHAVEANDAASYRAYLSGAARHSAEVSSLLLPRAELRDAESAGTVDAIQQFIKDHPQTAISLEVAAALRASLVQELEVAVKAGTLASLDDFVRRRGQRDAAGNVVTGVDPEIRSARHDIYKTAFDRYAAAAPPKAETAFIQRLLAWAEKKGPRAEIRFHLLKSKTMDKADSAVQKHRLYRGAVSLPSRHFDADDEKPKEDALAAAVAQQFQKAFPPEILAIVVGDVVADPDAPLPDKIAVPTLFIEHGPSWAGSIVGSKTPRGIFVGLQLSFAALFRIPDDAKPVKVKVDAWHAPNTAAATEEGKPEDGIYGEMRDKSYDQFQKKLLSTFFDTSK